ncbi:MULTISPECIES: GAF domain-containing protein [Saccharopolyspora]|uniref:GAF domain-containing protein n=1 Tax=Saccharopolyspora cebuensis TaxID=418759 RepID=A0ABV4C9W0_9PSEU
MAEVPEQQDEQWFLDRFGGGGPGAGGAGSALLRDVAAVRAELYRAPDAAGVLDRVAAAAVAALPGAGWASITIRDLGGELHTPAYTDPSALVVDDLQEDSGEGPFEEATAAAGTGMSGSPDLAREPLWPRFGPQAAGYGIRAVLATGIFPPHNRPAALSVCATEPRGLAALDPDVAVLLAGFALPAVERAAGPAVDDLRATALLPPVDDDEILGGATAALVDKRGLSIAECYPVLRRAARELTSVAG